jgi:hypothetical protein
MAHSEPVKFRGLFVAPGGPDEEANSLRSEPDHPSGLHSRNMWPGQRFLSYVWPGPALANERTPLQHHNVGFAKIRVGSGRH